MYFDDSEKNLYLLDQLGAVTFEFLVSVFKISYEVFRTCGNG